MRISVPKKWAFRLAILVGLIAGVYGVIDFLFIEDAEQYWFPANRNIREAAEDKGIWLLSLSWDYSPDGSLLALGHYTGTLSLHDAKTGKRLYELKWIKTPVHAVAFSPDSKFLASVGSDGPVGIWKADTGEFVKELGSERKDAEYSSMPRDMLEYFVTFSPDGKLVISAGWTGKISVWNISTGEYVRVFGQRHDGINSMSLTPDGKLLATAGYIKDRKLRLWNVHTGECVRDLHWHTGMHVLSVAFSPKGDLLVSGGQDSTIRVWNVHTGKCLRVLNEHGNDVSSLVFTRDGTRMASTGRDKRIRIWNTESWKVLRTIEPNKHVIHLVITPDDRIFLPNNQGSIHIPSIIAK